MSLNGWLQIVVFHRCSPAAREADGHLHDARLRAPQDLARSVLRPCERLLYRLTGIDANAGDALDRIRRRHAHLQRRDAGADLRRRAPAAPCCR